MRALDAENASLEKQLNALFQDIKHVEGLAAQSTSELQQLLSAARAAAAISEEGTSSVEARLQTLVAELAAARAATAAAQGSCAASEAEVQTTVADLAAVRAAGTSSEEGSCAAESRLEASASMLEMLRAEVLRLGGVEGELQARCSRWEADHRSISVVSEQLDAQLEKLGRENGASSM